MFKAVRRQREVRKISMFARHLFTEDRSELSWSEEAAVLRGLRVERHSLSGDAPPTHSNAPTGLICVRSDRLGRLSAETQSLLRVCVAQGATLHVKGEPAPGKAYSLFPFADDYLTTLPITVGSGYRLTDHPMLPSALRNEERLTDLTATAASDLPAAAEPLLLTRVDGGEHPSIFLLRVGDGVVIYDFVPDLSAPRMPLLQTLEDPATLPAAIGAVVAGAIAWKLDRAGSFFNLTIDDRPADFDYFNSARLLSFLRHLEYTHPNVHVDFAWTPDQSHPSRKYVEVLKTFRAGFVWHGLLRHIDHRSIRDLEAEFAEGRLLVEKISATYAVRFQPIMIFPFERDTPHCVEFLRSRGFVAKAQKPVQFTVPHADGGGDVMTINDRLESATSMQFSVLERFPVKLLTRDRMLARAALGLPIIAAAHPADLGLVRLAGIRPRGVRGSFDHFDPVLRFTLEKRLHPASLEEIAYSSMVIR